jgi:hypothetical protein
MALSLTTPKRGEERLFFNKADRYTGMGAAAREAPGDEGKPSGFSLIS